MSRAETASVILGALLFTAGATAIYWPVGLLVAGLFLLAAGLDVTP